MKDDPPKAKDYLKEISSARVEAAQNAGHKAFLSDPGRLGDAVTAAINEALAAADRVQAPAERPDMTLTDEDLGLVREWFNAVQDLSKEFLDRRDFALAKRILVHHGWRVPNSVERGCQRAETKSSHPRRGETWSAAHEAEKPDFPPWLWQTANLLKRVAIEMEQTLRARDRQHQANDVHDLRRAAFPETTDVG